MKKQNKSGYILVLTFMILALITVLVTQIFYQSSAFLPLADFAIARQKAKSLALGGVQLALSKLNAEPKVSQDLAQSKTADQKSWELFFVQQILPFINCWYTINLERELDGIDGQIQFCLTCEDSKINLNQLYDFKEHSFKDLNIDFKKDANQKKAQQQNNSQDHETQAVLMQLCEELSFLTNNQIDSQAAFDGLSKFLSERTDQILDVTQLLEIPAFNYFKTRVFRDKPTNSFDEQKSEIYLTDLFTVWSDHFNLEPWFLSISMTAILGFPRMVHNDIMKREQIVSEWTKDFKATAQWQADWEKTLGIVYGVSINTITKPVVNLFATKFNPIVFSVISCATINGVTQKVCAIIKAHTTDKSQHIFTVEKLYWI